MRNKFSVKIGLGLLGCALFSSSVFSGVDAIRVSRSDDLTDEAFIDKCCYFGGDFDDWKWNYEIRGPQDEARKKKLEADKEAALTKINRQIDDHDEVKRLRN